MFRSTTTRQESNHTRDINVWSISKSVLEACKLEKAERKRCCIFHMGFKALLGPRRSSNWSFLAEFSRFCQPTDISCLSVFMRGVGIYCTVDMSIDGSSSLGESGNDILTRQTRFSASRNKFIIVDGDRGLIMTRI